MNLAEEMSLAWQHVQCISQCPCYGEAIAGIWSDVLESAVANDLLPLAIRLRTGVQLYVHDECQRTTELLVGQGANYFTRHNHGHALFS